MTPPPSRSIRRTLSIGMFSTMMLALLIFAVAMIVYDLRDYRERILEDLQTQSELIGLTTAPALQFDDPALAAEGLRSLQARPNIFGAAIYNTRGLLFATFSSTEPPLTFPSLPAAQGYRIDGPRISTFHRIVENNEILGTVYIEAHYQLYERLQQYSTVVVAVMLFALTISTVISLRLQRQVTQPVQEITDVARQVVEQRNFALRAKRAGNDEIGYLADAFNALLSEVEARRSALEHSNQQLQEQIQERQRAAEEIRQLNAELESRVAHRTAELERANGELEAFSYSVSHDLRTPLRAIDGFSQALLEDYGEQLDDTAQDYLHRVRAGAQRMGSLIDDLLKLARVSRAEMKTEAVDLSRIAEEIVNELRHADPERQIAIKITSGLNAVGDPHLLRIALENLLNNAWKYTGKTRNPEIEFGMRVQQGEPCFFVADNGAGFDMAYASKLFGAFQRLHDSKDYAGTGVGLATVQRIIHRHGGHIWAEAAVNEGAVFYFTLPMTGDQNDEHQADSAG